MQPIFDLKGDNSQRADVSGSLGKLAYKNQFVWIARISNVFQVFQGFLFLWGIKIIRFPSLLQIFCTDNTLEHRSSKTDFYVVCFIAVWFIWCILNSTVIPFIKILLKYNYWIDTTLYIYTTFMHLRVYPMKSKHFFLRNVFFITQKCMLNILIALRD